MNFIRPEILFYIFDIFVFFCLNVISSCFQLSLRLNPCLFLFALFFFLPHVFFDCWATVYRSPLSVQAPAVTLRVCLSPRALCPVRTPPGKQLWLLDHCARVTAHLFMAVCLSTSLLIFWTHGLCWTIKCK